MKNKNSNSNHAWYNSDNHEVYSAAVNRLREKRQFDSSICSLCGADSSFPSQYEFEVEGKKYITDISLCQKCIEDVKTEIKFIAEDFGEI